MDKDALEYHRARWRAVGLVKVKNVFTRAEQDKILDHIEDVTGMTDGDVSEVLAGRKKPFLSPGTMVRHKVFWPIFYHDNILKLMHLFVADNIKFQGAEALSVHWLNQGFHTDSRVAPGPGPDWDPDNKEFRVARFLAYLNREGSPPKMFFFVPFSRSRSGDLADQDGMRFEDIFSQQVPILLEAGDCLVFDPRLRHTGGRLEGPKHMISLTYGVPNDHLLDTYFYGRIVRLDAGYTDMPDELVEELRARKLFMEARVDPAQWTRFEKIYASAKKEYPVLIDRRYQRDTTMEQRGRLAAGQR